MKIKIVLFNFSLGNELINLFLILHLFFYKVKYLIGIYIHTLMAKITDEQSCKFPYHPSEKINNKIIFYNNFKKLYSNLKSYN